MLIHLPMIKSTVQRVCGGNLPVVSGVVLAQLVARLAEAGLPKENNAPVHNLQGRQNIVSISTALLILSNASVGSTFPVACTICATACISMRRVFVVHPAQRVGG